MAAVASGFVVLPRLLRPGVERALLRISRVERGPVTAVLSTAGVVLPAFEQVVSSPVEARVLGLLKHPGEPVRAGEAIVELDTSSSRLQLDRLGDRLALKHNEQEQARLDLEAQVAGFEARLKSARLDCDVRAYRAENSRKLRAQGLVSDETLKAAEVDAEKATIDANQVTAELASARKVNANRLAGLALELETLRREQTAAAHELELATARADRDGIVTWTVPQEGATVARGDALARVAGLDSYRVEATVSDVHSARLRPGLAARIVLDGESANGTVSTIYPTIENGAVRFRIDLVAPSDSRLRNNLRVDVEVETGARADGLRLRSGPGVGSGEQEVFVLTPTRDRAERRRVRFGVSGNEFLEVLSGLAPGDEVIVSNLAEFQHLSSLRLN